VQKFAELPSLFSPGKNSIGEGMCSCDLRGPSIEAQFHRCCREHEERVIAVANRVRCGESVEFTFRNFNDGSHGRKQRADSRSCVTGKAAIENQGRQAASRTTSGARHRSRPTDPPAEWAAELRERNARCEAHRDRLTGRSTQQGAGVRGDAFEQRAN
jgi:hypothetical protein